MIQPKYNKQNNTIFLGFDSIGIQLTYYLQTPRTKFCYALFSFYIFPHLIYKIQISQFRKRLISKSHVPVNYTNQIFVYLVQFYFNNFSKILILPVYGALTHSQNKYLVLIFSPNQQFLPKVWCEGDRICRSQNCIFFYSFGVELCPKSTVLYPFYAEYDLQQLFENIQNSLQSQIPGYKDTNFLQLESEFP